MDNIQAFLSKFQHIKDPRVEKQKIINYLEENFNIKISIGCVELKDGKLKLKKITGAGRNLVFLNKDRIIGEINSILKKPIIDITF